MAELNGIGGTAATALSSIGSDLSVSISFQVASELVAGASESQLKDDELVAVVLAIAILLSAARSTLGFVRTERSRKFAAEVRERAVREWTPSTGMPRDEFVAACEAKEKARFASERTLLDFAVLFTSISSRIALSTTVQLLASAARGRQTSRSARVLTLISLSVFFVWLESSATASAF